MSSKVKTKKELTIPREHLAVYDVIANSKEKYVTKKQILAQLGQSVQYERHLLRLIHELVMIYEMPVGSSSGKYTKGYFIIESERDRQLAMKNLSTRTYTINERHDKIQKMRLK